MSSSSDSSSSESETSSKDKTVSKGLKRKRDTDVSKGNDENLEDGATTGSTSEPESDSDSDSDASEENIEQTETKSENVLSHAAQRKLKKKAKKAAESHEEEATKKVVPETLNPKRQNSIWVGNLAFKTTEQALRDFFTRHVPGCEITRVNMPKKGGQDIQGGAGMRGQNKGFAYVDFSTENDKTKAIEASEQNLDGRKLLIKDGLSYEGRPAGPVVDGDITKSKTAKKILASQKQPPGPTLFFGNLSFQVTESSLQTLLERNWKSHGTVKNDTKDQNQEEKSFIRKIRLGTFEDSGKCKGWAFIDFHNPADATHALINPKNHFLDGRKLVVEYASQEAVRRGGGAPRVQDKANRKKHPKGSEQDRSEGQDNDQQDAEADVDADANVDETPIHKKRKLESTTRPKRAKPGAALAMAKRETAAIVPSIGKKIVF